MSSCSLDDRHSTRRGTSKRRLGFVYVVRGGKEDVAPVVPLRAVSNRPFFLSKIFYIFHFVVCFPFSNLGSCTSACTKAGRVTTSEIQKWKTKNKLETITLPYFRRVNKIEKHGKYGEKKGKTKMVDLKRS